VSRAQREKYEATINAQVDELNAIRQGLYDLEQKHGKIRQQYEEEVRALRAELFAMKQSSRPPQPSVFTAPETYRDRDERDRGVALRDRERGVPDREREGTVREHRDREARERELDRERFLDVQRDAKRIKESTLGPLMGPGSTPALPPPPAAVPAARLTPTPRLPPRPAPVNDFLADTPDPSVVPPQWKKEGSDWFVLYNPAIPRTLDVSLVHTFLHETVVCCVQFSADGKWLATGCNRTAQIFDVQTGQKAW
jgi:glucose repression regulatory protein TUP1